jgi:hypothetical protein
LGDCAIPVLRDLKVSASGFCAGAEGVTFSFDATDKDAQYQLYKNGVATGAILNGTGNAASFTKKFDAGTYTARAEKNSLFCEASMNGSHVITENPLPVAPNIAQPVDVCQNTDNIVFTATNYTGTLAWTANGGGTETDNSVAFSSNLFGTKSVTARSEQSYQGAPTCYSATVTRSAMVYAAPVINTQPKSQGFCSLFASATLTVAATPVNGKNLTYQWKEGEGDGIDVGTNSNAYTATVSKKTDYWVVITNENKCTTTSKKATINLKGGYMAGEIGSGEVCKSGPGQIGNGN